MYGDLSCLHLREFLAQRGMSLSPMRPDGPRPRRVGQSEIAAAAGVSVSTVSRVLSNAPGISADVRESVRRIARRMGYRFYDQVPQRTLPRATVFLGSPPAAQEIGETIYSNIVLGIRDAADAAGIPLNVVVRERVGMLPAGLLEDRQAGVFFLGIDPNEDSMHQIAEAKIAAVLVNGLDPDVLVDSVAPANFFGGRLAARYLIESGHRALLHVSNRNRWTLSRRADGFFQGVSDFGKARSVTAEMLDVEHLSNSMFPAMDAYIKSAKFRFTAVFCGNDSLAMAMIQALKANGYDVPGTVSVLGFDDRELAVLSNPPLSTINVDWRGLGAEAVRLMISRVQDPARSPMQVQLGVRLVLRDSVAPM